MPQEFISQPNPNLSASNATNTVTRDGVTENIPINCVTSGTTNFLLTNAMGTAAQVVKASSAFVGQLTNGTQAAIARINVYDAATTGAAVAATLIWSGPLADGASIILDQPCVNGVVINSTVAVAATGTVCLGFA